MRSTASAATESTTTTAAPEATTTRTRVAHTRDSVVTPHLRFRAAANAAEGAAIASGILAFETLAAEALSRLGS